MFLVPAGDLRHRAMGRYRSTTASSPIRCRAWVAFYSARCVQPSFCRGGPGGPDGFDSHGSSTLLLTYVAAWLDPIFKSRDTHEGASSAVAHCRMRPCFFHYRIRTLFHGPSVLRRGPRWCWPVLTRSLHQILLSILQWRWCSIRVAGARCCHIDKARYCRHRFLWSSQLRNNFQTLQDGGQLSP
jgi:hypothetical protein